MNQSEMPQIDPEDFVELVRKQLKQLQQTRDALQRALNKIDALEIENSELRKSLDSTDAHNSHASEEL